MSKPPFLALDTEFLRERTYYPQLCLVQVAAPEGDAILLDPISGDDMSDLEAALFDPDVVKVFHAGRQDLEIFVRLFGRVPAPLFDTQIAAMALGYGESVSYAALVADVCRHSIDKSQQYTDWSIRPLRAEQLAYAADDVLYLRTVYENFCERLERRGRRSWIEEEMAALTNPAIYSVDPDHAWERVKIRSDKPHVLAVLRALAAWREREAQRRDIPKGRVFKDETLAEIAMTQPRDARSLARVRGFPTDLAEKNLGQTILKIIEEALALPREEMPRIVRAKPFPQELQPVLEMLKMLLRIQASEAGIAPRLLADSDDLQALAIGGENAPVPCLSGWRRAVFGEQALALTSGRLSLSVDKGQIVKTHT
ncbi:MAG: ribonuclease D [Rhodospirillales bacterium]|nr:ribonuclease D [Alphaproteobacteria bacterium]MCB9986324.1 ribonuclease D [Rhodospirillales bacterium]USO07125.1 MAG: ribonuclease D [Rhodospirillales bacterium]